MNRAGTVGRYAVRSFSREGVLRVLGIDPGLRLTGYACLDGLGDRPEIVEAGVFRLGKRPAIDAADEISGGGGGSGGAVTVSSRLAELDTDFRDLLERLHPEAVAVEAIFAHYKHPATAIVMGHARGVLLLAIRNAGLRLLEFKPNAVKKSLTGNGHAGKPQMQRAIQAHFGLPEPPSPPDVADALAIALCACRRISLPTFV